MKQHCLITGGASGMGESLALIAASAGYDVSIVSLETEREKADSIISEISSLGREAAFYAADVLTETDIVSAYAGAVERFGPPTGVFHAAGVFKGASVHELDYSDVSLVMNVNVVGLMICCREAVRHMSTRFGGNGGSIVNVSSMSATIGGRPGHSFYAASKGAVDIFTQGIAREVAQQGIRVNTVRPGAVATPMTAGLESNPALKKAVEESIPLGRLGQPEEIAEIAMWLMSPSGTLVTGACIDAGGGGFIVAGAL